jgi:hypothetical protein
MESSSSRMINILCSAALTVMVFAVHGATSTQSNGKLDNTVPSAQIVLPGFKPIEVRGNVVILGATRQYTWSNGAILPTELTHQGTAVVQDMGLYVDLGSGLRLVTSSSRPSLHESNGHDVTVLTRGRINEHVELNVETRIEYDGVGMIDITFESDVPVKIERFEFRMTVAGTEYTRMLRFNSKILRDRRKPFVFAPEFEGAFSNAIGLASGENSIWWFADRPTGWVFGDLPAVSIKKADDGDIEFSQRIIGGSATIKSGHRVSFNFLLTPVRETTPWRQHRIARSPAKKDSQYGNLNLWWIDAFAHETYPYVTLSKEALEALPVADHHVYKGAAAARKKMAKWKRKGVDLIPYFSAHALAAFDPAYVNHLSDWRVIPPYVMPGGSDAPFTAKLPRSWLSHRSGEYTDYLISRFGDLIDEIGFEGLYFDQGGIIDSSNETHQPWTDGNGRVHGATDILESRMFYKRLAELFYAKHRKGLIFVHNSGSTILPAYTFATSMVQGEEYLHKLSKPDYVSAIDIDELRSGYAPGQYGVGLIWLSELWSPRVMGSRHAGKEEWLASSEYEQAFRGYEAIAALHDIPTWSLASLQLRKPYLKNMDKFGAASAKFVGYWASRLSDTGSSLYVSYYQKEATSRAFLVIANLSEIAQSFRIDDLADELFCKEREPLRVVKSDRIEDLAFEGTSLIGRLTAANYGIAVVEPISAGNVQTENCVLRK